MKKDYKRTGWILVILLSLLSVITGWILWGRVFSEIFPTLPISQSYICFVQFQPIASFIDSTQKSALYVALYGAIHAADGSLAPLSDLFGLLGIVSFTITAINEVSSTRSYGILVGDVINYYFPQRQIIMIGFHGIFFLMGWFSCYEHVGFAAALSLVGLLACFVYSFYMAWCFVLYPAERKKRVLNYFTNVMTTSTLVRLKTRDQCIMEYASYIGELWNRTSYHSNLVEEDLLVKVVYSWLQNADLLSVVKRNEQPIVDSVDRNLQFRAAFLEIFDLKDKISKDDIPYCGEYLLFTQCLNVDVPNARTTFQRKIINCSVVWENLFSQISSSHRQSQMAYELLKTAKKYDKECFILFSCGLVHQMGIFKPIPLSADAIQSIEQRLDFLQNLSRASWEDKPSWELDKCSEFTATWCELIYIILGSFLWSDAFGQLSAKDSLHIREIAQKSIISSSLPEFLLNSLRKSWDIYSAYAFILFSCANINIYKGLSAYELCLQHKYVTDKMRLGLDSKNFSYK